MGGCFLCTLQQVGQQVMQLTEMRQMCVMGDRGVMVIVAVRGWSRDLPELQSCFLEVLIRLS